MRFLRQRDVADNVSRRITWPFQMTVSMASNAAVEARGSFRNTSRLAILPGSIVPYMRHPDETRVLGRRCGKELLRRDAGSLQGSQFEEAVIARRIRKCRRGRRIAPEKNPAATLREVHRCAQGAPLDIRHCPIPAFQRRPARTFGDFACERLAIFCAVPGECPRRQHVPALRIVEKRGNEEVGESTNHPRGRHHRHAGLTFGIQDFPHLWREPRGRILLAPVPHAVDDGVRFHLGCEAVRVERVEPNIRQLDG